MDKSYTIGALVGRFQVHELHEAHHYLIDQVVKNHKKVILFLGVPKVVGTKKNPLDFESRKKMIQHHYPEIVILALPDFGDDKRWSHELDKRIKEVYPIGDVLMYGGRDSFIPYYKNGGGQFDCQELDEYGTFVSGTEVRKMVSEEVKDSADFRAGVIYQSYNQYPKVHPCVDVAITDNDKVALTRFINEPNQRFTQGEKVREFEEEWCKFLGCSHSVYVNSGASANYIMASMMKEQKGLGEVIVSPLGWVSDVSPLVNLGFTPVFVDVDMSNMSITLENIKRAVTDKTVGVTLVHVLGFNAITDEMVHFCRDNDLFLIEDCCEAHGATNNGDRVGIYGDVSNFSFYFGHHITSIEGGMVCVNNPKLLDLVKLFRSHGMTREASPELQQEYKKLKKEAQQKAKSKPSKSKVIKSPL